jgi:tRNA(fMet)-specific endonuclease VapC
MGRVTLYMLDTNTISYLVRQQSSVVRHVLEIPTSFLCVSSATAGELYFGLARLSAAHRLHMAVREFLARVDVLPWDDDVAERYGVFKAASQRVGKVLGPLDLLIAAHALTVGAVLVTSDRAFSQIEELQLEDWTS